MLPTETFAEAVAFLRLFDLGALAVTNALCSSLAMKASNEIRWEQFPGLQFSLGDRFIKISRTPGPAEMAGSEVVAKLSFASVTDMTDFVAAAFPNCIFDDVVVLWYVGQHLLDAIARVADCVVIRGAVCLLNWMDDDYILKLVRRFRKVNALRTAIDASDNEANVIANFFRGSGLHELLYYSTNDRTFKKLVLF